MRSEELVKLKTSTLLLVCLSLLSIGKHGRSRFPTSVPKIETADSSTQRYGSPRLGLVEDGNSVSVLKGCYENNFSILINHSIILALYVALKRLGYTCYHMAECGLDVENNSMIYWHEAIDAKFDGKGNKYVGEDFDKMLWRYDVRSQSPCSRVRRIYTKESHIIQSQDTTKILIYQRKGRYGRSLRSFPRRAPRRLPIRQDNPDNSLC